MSNNKKKSLDEINAEIEQQILEEMETPPEEKKKRRAIFSAVSILPIFILLSLLYNIIKLYLN